MPVSEKEALSSLRVLVAVAKADGILAEEERRQLEDVLSLVPLPQGTTLRNLLDETPNIDVLLGEVKSPEARDACYQSAFALANADGDYSPEEKRLIEHIRKTFAVSEEKAGPLGRLFNEAKDTVLPSNIKPISDPVRRAAEIKEDTFKYAILSGALGAFPIPGLAIFTDLAAVGLQVKLVRDIGQYYGHAMDKKAATTLLASVGVGAGARIAVTNLAKLVPVWGSAVGAAASFAATYAVGQLATAYFESGGKADINTLKAAFESAKKVAKDEYSKNKEAIAAKQKENEAKIKALSEDRKAGRIGQEEYERRLSELA